MPPISQEKKDKIAAQILQHLYSVSPEAIFTVSVASEIARDEEFTKTLLEELKRKKLVVEVSKNKDVVNPGRHSDLMGNQVTPARFIY